MISLDKCLWMVSYCGGGGSGGGGAAIPLPILKVQFTELYPFRRLYVSIGPKPGLCEDCKGRRLL